MIFIIIIMYFSRNKMNIKHLINECVLYEMRKAQIRKMVAEELIHQLNEKKKTETSKNGDNKTKSTQEIEIRTAYRKPMINGAALADKICPKDWKDSTKRSYVSKLFGKNKNPRKPTDTDLEKGHNAIDKV